MNGNEPKLFRFECAVMFMTKHNDEISRLSKKNCITCPPIEEQKIFETSFFRKILRELNRPVSPKKDLHNGIKNSRKIYC